MKKLIFISLLFLVAYVKNEKNIGIKNNLIQDTFLSIERTNVYTKLPDSLGGNKTHGFAVIQAIYNEKFHLTKINLEKLHTVGSKTISYWYPNKLSKEAARYLLFFEEYARSQKIKINKNSKEINKENRISYIVRF